MLQWTLGCIYLFGSCFSLDICPEVGLQGHIVAPDFSGRSDGKESTCNVGDLGLIPGLGRSPGGGHGNPLQYSWASLMAQLVNNLPVIQEIWVWSLGWEDPRGKGMAAHSSILTGEFHGLYSPLGRNELDMNVQLSFSKEWQLFFKSYFLDGG